MTINNIKIYRQNSVDQPKNQQTPKILKTIRKVAFEAIKAFGLLLALTPPGLVVLGIVKYLSLKNFKIARNELSLSCLISLKKLLIIQVPDTQKTFAEITKQELIQVMRKDLVEEKAAVLAEGAMELIHLLKKDSSLETATSDLFAFRSSLNETLATPEYVASKESMPNPTVYLVQLASHLLTCQGPGAVAARKMGEKVAEQMKIKETSHWSDLAKYLKNSIRTTCTFNRDTIINKLFYYLAFPEKTFYLLRDRMERFAYDYNSYQHGNFNFKTGDFVFGAEKPVKIGTFFGPGPGTETDQVIKGEKDFLKNAKELSDMILLRTQISFEDNKGSEGKRKEKIRGLKETYFWTAGGDLDGAVWKGNGIFATISSPADFIKKLQAVTKDSPDQIFQADASAISQDELAKGYRFFSSATSFFTRSAHWDKLKSKKVKGEQRLNRALSIALQSFFMMRILINMYKEIETSQSANLQKNLHNKLDQDLERLLIQPIFGAACKQNIDRGLVMNILLRLYTEVLAGQPLTKEKIHEIIGYVLLRPGIIDGRAIIKDRFQALYDLLMLVGENEKIFIEPLRNYLIHDAEHPLEMKMQDPQFFSFQPA